MNDRQRESPLKMFSRGACTRRFRVSCRSGSARGRNPIDYWPWGHLRWLGESSLKMVNTGKLATVRLLQGLGAGRGFRGRRARF